MTLINKKEFEKLTGELLAFLGEKKLNAAEKTLILNTAIDYIDVNVVLNIIAKDKEGKSK